MDPPVKEKRETRRRSVPRKDPPVGKPAMQCEQKHYNY